MNTFSAQPTPGHYRRAGNICLVGETAICSYPLRAVRLHTTAMRLLLLCEKESTCEELAQQTNLPIGRIKSLCEQLRWKGLLEAGPPLPPAIWPGISIIIPTRNRKGQLERCMRSLVDVKYPNSCMEVIVVDDASTSEVSPFLQPFREEFEARGIRMQIIRNAEQQGVAACRNTGARAAQFEVLAYIDSDCVASPSWLVELAPVLQDESVGAIGGMIRAYERESMLGRYEDVRSSLFMGMQAQQMRLEGPLMYLATANLLVRKALWEEVGGFAPLTFGEDVDFCRRMLAGGSRIVYVPRGLVYHDYRTRLWSFLSIRASYASAEAALLQRHPNERRILVLPPEQATFASLAIGGVWGTIWIVWKELALPIGRNRLTSLHLPLFSILLAIFLTIFSVRNRMRKVREQKIPIGLGAVLQATVRGHLAFTYHLCRHLTRYYTLLVVLIGMLVPPLLVLVFILYSVVIVVDYARLRPQMNVGQYALCSLLDDCAYEIGVVIGCIRQRTWRPLVPVIRKKNPVSVCS